MINNIKEPEIKHCIHCKYYNECYKEYVNANYIPISEFMKMIEKARNCDKYIFFLKDLFTSK